jgi:two-component system sensor histidine kinase BaeS
MRRRLTVTILVLVAATVVVTTLGSAVFIRHAALGSGTEELAGQARAISATFSGTHFRTKAAFQRDKLLISEAADLAGIAVVALRPDGSLSGAALPSGITVADLDVSRLEQGRQITGHTSSLLAYSAVPTPINGITAYLPVLVVTRQIHDPATGIRYFLLIGVIGLVLAAVVATALARRFTRPVVAAVSATRRIASGDLDATVPVRPGEDPEFAQLADSINAMGASLVRAREQERQFLLSVSHELRTPLTSIRGYAEAVTDGATDDPAAAAAVIGSEARRLERLVQDLLDLARLDADRFSLDLRTVDCTEVVGQVADGFRPQAAERGLELATVLTPGPLWVTADADRLGQVVANLVENAASFARRQLTVGAGVVEGRPVVWVGDDGPGIPPDQLERVFERHFTSDRGRSRGRRKGSGLGLAIVAELAAAMGAGVRAESPVTADGGTRMVVWLRPADGVPALAPPPVAGALGSADGGRSVGPGR